ncbi:hypothetical protein DL239_20130 [Sedimentitalea sp. CY04]|uniref:Uncharacterized protein n=1 Tax=Parasedimentitalea denitrificans TaxID=2211118 RepID=A0ABX0WC48_9RHOB|nr:hypothetical protein [Sedimentitalea sp. CY04]NIZ63279.1 hypothetical protein [Sedimentitalea sp. CY04]
MEALYELVVSDTGVRSRVAMSDEKIMENNARIQAATLARATRDLSPSEFEWLLGYTELDDIWDAMIASLKGSTDEADKRTRAALKAHRRKSLFRFATTLQLVSDFRPMAATINPNIDLSDAVIEAAWAKATEVAA